MAENQKLKFSIVTVCFNAESTIEKTIQSVLSQVNCSIEFIVVDGASKDNTLAIAKKYADRITRIISEPDKGIYDAMNKGIAAATGDYVFFLNCGDRFISEHVIERAGELIVATSPKPDVFYGKILVLDEKNLWGFVSGIDFVNDRILFLDNIPHQAAFTQVPLLQQRGYNQQHRIAADFDWFVYAHKEQHYTFKFSDIIVSYFDPFGLSSDATSLNARTKERVEILSKYYTKPQLFSFLIYHYIKTLKYPAKKRSYVTGILNEMRKILFGL